MHKGIESWKILLTWAFNFFSIPLLVRTLFAPWQQDRSAGTNFGILEKVTFAIFSRVLGLLARSILIAFGLALTLLTALTFPIFFFLPISIKQESLLKLGSFGAQLSYGNTFRLNKIGHDVIANGDLRLYGKEKAIRMIKRALSKENNHNILLVGDIGVGKDTLIDYLGWLGQSGLSSLGIKHHRVVDIELENISAEDFDKSLVEAREAGNVILVLKNIHNYESIYERLLPYLNSPHLAIIATSDFGNYDQILKRHVEFLSKFEKIDVLQTNPQETLSILLNYSLLNKTKIKPGVLVELITLADKFIMNEAEPLKSILLFDELRALGKKEITIDDVRQIISDKTNIPLGALGADEKQVLKNLESLMLGKVIGQDQAVREVASAMKRMRAGIANPSKPAGTFLFLGPSGVGKTYTAKILAESYFGRTNAMIRFDMSEFALPDSLPNFADRLAAAIEEAPMSLVFFDELEKANHDIHQLLLQVLDEGMFTRESGRVANFKNAIIIATSNAGSASIIADPGITQEYLIQEIIRERTFAPEFLNRFSGVVLFLPLTQQSVRQIAALLLTQFAARLFSEKGLKLLITPELVEAVARKGYDPNFGARPIHRAIEELVENKIAEYIIEGKTEGIIKIM